MTFYVIQIDDSGKRIICEGYATAAKAALAAARLDSRIDASALASDWSFVVEDCRYEIGTED